MATKIFLPFHGILTQQLENKSANRGGIALGCLAIPSALWVSNTAEFVFSGKLSLLQVIIGYPILFSHNIALSGLPGEFFFPVFLQTRLSILLKSKLGGILLTSLFFGLMHIDELMQWYPGMNLSEAFCRAFFIQGFIGIIFGVLWARTDNIIPVIIAHSGINAINNLEVLTKWMAL